MKRIFRRGAIKWAAPGLFLLGLVALVDADPGNDPRAPDLTAYPKLKVDEGNKVAFWAYAEGVQVYRWTGTAWAFVAPEAVLYDGDGEPVGTHYVGPTWESASGSYVVGVVMERATPDPDAIPWLKLQAIDSDGSGVFDGTTFIQRVNTTGGKAPAVPGSFEDEIVRVPYTAEYYFYRKHR